MLHTATSVKRQSFAPRQGGLKLAVDAPSRTSNSCSSPQTASAAASQGSGSNSSSANSSSNGANQPPVASAEGGSLQPHMHYRTAGSDSSCLYQQQNGDSKGAAGGLCGSGCSSAVQTQLQLLRAHHAGLMRLGLLMALTM